MTLSVALSHRFDTFSLDVDFDAPAGVTVLFGRSGSGKTSVVNAVAGLFQPEQGRIMHNETVLFDSDQGQMLAVHKRRLGYVFQDARLFPHLSVAQNLRYARWFSPRHRRRAEWDAVIEMLGLGALLSRRPGALSGGERQRVAIGRALLASPDLILADEPLASLDAARKAEILPYFERLRDTYEIPMLYVSHSAAEVARLATTVVVLDQGRVVRQGAPSAVLSDPTVVPTGIRSVGAVLEARVLSHHDDGLTELEAGDSRLFLPKIAHSPGQTLRVRVPAQDVLLAREKPMGLSALNMMRGHITHIRSGDGPGVMVSLKTRAGTVLARVTRRSAEQLGLETGVEAWAIVKTVSIAPEDVGGS